MLLLLLSLFSQPALAENQFQAHGRVFADVYGASKRSTKRFHELSATGWLQFEQRWSAASAILNLEGEQFGNSSTHKKANAAFNIREGYLTYFASGFEMRAGKQIIPWGKSDGFNPTDVLTAKNYSKFNSDEEVRRRGSTSLQMTFTPNEGTSPVTITGIFTAIPATSILLIPSTSIPNSAEVQEAQKNPVNLANSEQAIKISYYTPSWDLALIGFRGKGHVPDLTNGGFSGSIFKLVPVYHDVKVVGEDASITMDSFVARWETAYYWTENDNGQNPLIEPSHADTVLGVERPFGDNIRINLQGLYKYIPKFTDPNNVTVGSNATSIFLNRQVSTANSVLHGYQDKSRAGATFRFAYGNDNLPYALEFFSLYYPATSEYLLRPKASYKWTENFKTELGLEEYGGPPTRQLGAFREYNSVFFEARYVF